MLSQHYECKEISPDVLNDCRNVSVFYEKFPKVTERIPSVHNPLNVRAVGGFEEDKRRQADVNDNTNLLNCSRQRAVCVIVLNCSEC